MVVAIGHQVSRENYKLDLPGFHLLIIPENSTTSNNADSITRPVPENRAQTPNRDIFGTSAVAKPSDPFKRS